jgi:hypothetical protein
MNVALLLAFAVAASAQPCTNGPKLPPQTFVGLEHIFNDQLASFKDPIDTFGSTRALYLHDYGVTISVDVSLVQAPGPNPFRRDPISDKEKAEIHRRKIAQVPLLKKAMRDIGNQAALVLAGKIGSPQFESSGLQIAVIVRLVYLPYEDTKDLPAQITVQANLKNAMNNTFLEDVQ